MHARRADLPELSVLLAAPHRAVRRAGEERLSGNRYLDMSHLEPSENVAHGPFPAKGLEESNLATKSTTAKRRGKLAGELGLDSSIGCPGQAQTFSRPRSSTTSRSSTTEPEVIPGSATAHPSTQKPPPKSAHPTELLGSSLSIGSGELRGGKSTTAQFMHRQFVHS